MKVILVNGSPHQHGCTDRALQEVAAVLEAQGVETEIFWLGNQPIAGCIACGACAGGAGCFRKDVVNDFVEKSAKADGFVFGSPVYYAGMSGQLKSFMDRAFYCGSYTGKPAAAVVSCRRGGASAAYDQINKFAQMNNMPLVTSQYWNQVHGSCAADVEKDEEGLQTMRTLGMNMAWLLKSIQNGGQEKPSYETKIKTNFIR